MRNSKEEPKQSVINVFYALATCLILITASIIFVMFASDESTEIAWADELSNTKEELAAQVDKLDELTAQIKELDAQINEKADAAIKLESEIADNQKSISEMSVFFYKNPSTSLLEYLLSSDDIGQMITRAEFLYDYTEEISQITAEQRAADIALHEELDAIGAQKDEQVSAQEELKAIVNDLQAKVDKLTAEQRAKLAQGSTFATEFDGEFLTGRASAYGGPTDSAGNVTATGDTVSGSIGVAVPMNQRQYLGRKVEVSYGGKSVICICNDVGGFAGYGRALDLNYNVIACFGFNSCNSWGVRTVQYRWL